MSALVLSIFLRLSVFAGSLTGSNSVNWHLRQGYVKERLLYINNPARDAFQCCYPFKNGKIRYDAGCCHDRLSKARVNIFSLPPSNTVPSLNDSLHSLRGGDIMTSFLSIPAPSKKATLITAQMLSAYLFIVGTYLITYPSTQKNSLLKGVIDDIQEDTFESYLLQAIGTIVLGFSIHIILTLVLTLQNCGNTVIPIPNAMGYALLPRVLLIFWTFLRQGKAGYHLDGSTFLKINFVMATWTAFSLLTGVGNPNVSTKVFSTLSLVKSTALMMNTAEMTKKIFNVDISGEEMAKSRLLARVLGNYLTISAVLMMALAFGINPVAAAGISAAVWFVLLFDMAFVTKAWKWFCVERHVAKQYFHMLVALLATAIFTLAPKA